MEDNTSFATIFGLLKNGKRKKFEEEFTNFRKLQLKGGVKAKIELCKLIELVLVSDGRFTSLLISDLYNLLTDKNKNVALKALDTISLCIDTLIFNAIECHVHKDLVSDKLYIPGGVDFKNVLADFECLRSTYISLIKSTKDTEVIFLLYKILASELQAFALIDVSDYIVYDNNNHFNTLNDSNERRLKKPNYPDCNCACKFLSKYSSTISYGELKPFRFSKCTTFTMKDYFERLREENIQLLSKYLIKSKNQNLHLLMSIHIASLAIACYPLTYSDLLTNLFQLLDPIKHSITGKSSKGSIDAFIFKQLIRILASKVAVSLHKEISEYLYNSGYITGLDIIYREINCIGSVIMECYAPIDFDRVYIMSCNFEDFGGLCSIPENNKFDGKLLEKRGPIYYITRPERVELIGHLAVTKPLSKLIDIALGYDVSKDSEGRSRNDVTQFFDIPACKVLYYSPEILKFEVKNTSTDMDLSEEDAFKQMKDNLLVESPNYIETRVASTNEVSNNFNFYSKMVVNQILKTDLPLNNGHLDIIKRKLMNKILLDNYLQPGVAREMLKMYINTFISKLDLTRYVKSSPDALMLQNALNEWTSYFNCVTDMLYHKSVLNYIDSSLVKQEYNDNTVNYFNYIHTTSKDDISYDELLQLCFDGFYSEKILINRAYRDAYIKSICSFILSIPCITEGIIDRFHALLDNMGGSLLVFSLVSNILKKSKSIGAKRRVFSLFFKALYHKTPSVRNLFYKLIESHKGLYMTFDNQTCKYSIRDFERLHDYLSILVASKYGERCNTCKSGGISVNVTALELALSPPIWQWPIEIITMLINWSKSLGIFQSVEIQVTTCPKCKRTVFDVTYDKILYNVLNMWDNTKEDLDLGWYNPHYIHNIWLQECIFYIFIKCLIKYPISNEEMPLDDEMSSNIQNKPEKKCIFERFLVPNSFLKQMCDEIIASLDADAIDISINAVSAICNRSPNLLSALLYIIDTFSLEHTKCTGKVCSGITETIIDKISTLGATHIDHFYQILENYLSLPPKTCLMGHVLNNIASRWSDPAYNIVDKFTTSDSAEIKIITHCTSIFKNSSVTIAIVPMVAYLPKNIATELIEHLFIHGDENALKSCIESVLSIPGDIRGAMDSRVSNPGQQWLLPEELLITIYRFNSPNVDWKKQALLLDHVISLVETNQRRPQSVPKNVVMSLHSVVKSCTMIVESAEPISFIFGRLLCQVVQNIPSVRGGIVQHVMPVLVTRRAWEEKQLWRGVVISFGILWSEFKEPLTLLIFQLPQVVGEDLLQGVQQRHSVIPEMAAIVSKKEHIRSMCPKYISSILGL